MKDLTGRRFGRLEVIRQDGMRGASVAWQCQCDCGNVKTISSKHLSYGVTNSCGCLARESARNLIVKQTYRHGRSMDKVYKVWTAMVQRCHNENNEYYYNYGARGIVVCDRWKNDFAAFLHDMGESNGGTLDRIDNNGNYEPSNCRWVSRHEQMRNTRRTVMIEFNGETLCAKDWARRLGLPSGQTITWRLKQGWSIEKALTTPARGH